MDLLPDRRAASFTAWLRAQPGAEVICRDWAGGYAEGARLGAPTAIQVADRFHLPYNPTRAVDRVVRAHRKSLRERPEHADVAQPAPQSASDYDRRAQLTRQRHAEIHALLSNGIGITAICKALSLDGKTVLRDKDGQPGAAEHPVVDASFRVRLETTRVQAGAARLGRRGLGRPRRGHQTAAAARRRRATARPRSADQPGQARRQCATYRSRRRVSPRQT
ncbi:transposase [Dactylosporangium siamense]|uniref:transposase n=1 Tax=Dactylosporangium siamense TaxID=685454 RepID=UPI0035711849